ncbi:PIG-L family deacetylase [Haematomicrobium sanguinis]|uniref:PIG-L family deacetylase n=1 Tax=Haematomicrobium sanguinis TaxID=479106 RepID=UPI00068CCF69|nr:PIG-L family deacetylase [Haematomicrobium sanguinis]
MSFTHLDKGTAADTWDDAGLGDLPTLPFTEQDLSRSTVVLLAAHPDDETLGAAGLLHAARRAGATVRIMLASLGERSHPESLTHSQADLKEIRAREFHSAMERLGLDTSFTVVRFPDGHLGNHHKEILGALYGQVDEFHGAGRQLLLVSPYRADKHPDHEALAKVAAEAAEELSATHLQYPIWYWHWAMPSKNRDWTNWYRWPLNAADLEAKRGALAEHRSQIAPLSDQPGDETLLSENFQQHFGREWEVFSMNKHSTQFTSHDAARVFDEVHSDQPDPWGTESTWYEQRKRRLSMTMLPSERYNNVLEIGCSIGTMTADLATRADTVFALDASDKAVALARQNTACLPGVAIERATLPQDLRSVVTGQGEFDLIVLSEVGYYFTAEELDELLDTVESISAPGTQLLACHWRHPILNWSIDGDTVHRTLLSRPAWTGIAHYDETDFRVDILALTPDTRSGNHGAATG